MNDAICPCFYIKIFTNRFIMIVMYVDDLNIIETLEEVLIVIEYFEGDFEMKFLEGQNFVSTCKSSI